MLLLLWDRRLARRRASRQAVDLRPNSISLYAAGLLIDRLYQFARFGSFWNTYISLFAQEQRLNRSLAAS